MHDEEYLAAIALVKKRKREIFTEQIRGTEKYCLLCNHPDKCSSDQEKQLLVELDRLDRHMSYNNANLLLQIHVSKRALFLREANRMLNKIEALVQAIDWGKGNG